MTTETPAFVDALPFVDVTIDEDERERAEAMRLVDDEIDTYPPARDYIDHLPDIKHRPFSTPALEAEYQRIETNDETMRHEEAEELSRIETDIPPPARSNMDEEELQLWRDCLNQIKIKLEYRQRQLLNLDLLKTYGGPAWEQFIKQNEMMEASMKQELEELGNKIQEINASRKKHQESTLRNLNVLQSEWDNLSVSNQMLAEEIERLRRSHKESEKPR